jgi:hypothetical protein
MTCNFSLRHYEELLRAAQAGGYRFVHFDKQPEPGDLFLRHDVDLSLDAAVELAVRFDRVMAWHNPDPGYMFEPVGSLVNVMAEPHFSKEHYRSDSNHNWRNGCPHEELAAGSFEWLQLLVHPELWAYEGATMRGSMEAMLAHEQERDWERLAEDRIDLS